MKLAIVLLVLLCSGMSQMACAESWRAPRLPWGEPDLQGAWNSSTLTGLERFKGIDDLVLTEAQARELEHRDAVLMTDIDNLPEGDLPSGKVVGGYNTIWLDRGTQLLRIDGEPRTSIINDPGNGKVPYTVRGWMTFWLTMLGTQKRNNPEEQLLGDRCVVGYGSTGGPPMIPVEYNNNYQIVQSPGEVKIVVEMNHSVRNIRIDGKPLPNQIRPWMGDSIGHWEGDTLVVETTQFHPQQSLRGAIKYQFYVGKDTRVTERFTRTRPDEIHYAFTMDDDALYRHSWHGELTFRPSDGDIYEYACHEGNYGMVGMLSAARDQNINGIRWLYRLLTNMPEEVSHKQLSNSRFADQ